MPAQYRVWLYDQDGDRVAWMNGYTYLSYTRKLNEPDSYEIHLPGDHWTVTAGYWELPAKLDGEIVVLRRPEDETDWSAETACLNRYFRDAYEGANHYIYSMGRGALALLRRRLIVPAAGAAYDSRSGLAGNVIPAYINAQAGPGAGARAIPDLYISGWAAVGNLVSEEARYYRLDETIGQLVAAGQVDLAIVPVYTAGMDDWDSIQAAGMTYLARQRYGWQLRLYHPQMGTDRRRGNAYGNAPVIFSLLRGNMQNPSYIWDGIDIGNHAYVLGQGTEADRAVLEVVDGSVGDSPWNDWEYSRDARNSSTVATLLSTGRAENEAQRAQEQFSFQSLETAGCRYGVHWTLGDWATADYAGRSFDVRCIEVKVTLSSDQSEEIAATWRADFAGGP